jgi:hypothetical protein
MKIAPDIGSDAKKFKSDLVHFCPTVEVFIRHYLAFKTMVLNHQHSVVLGIRCTQKWQNGWKCGWNLVEKDKITQFPPFLLMPIFKNNFCAVLRALGHQGHGRHGRLLCLQTWVKGYVTWPSVLKGYKLLFCFTHCQTFYILHVR